MKYLLCVDGSEYSRRAVDKLCQLMNPYADSAIIYSAFVAPTTTYLSFHSSDPNNFFPSARSDYHRHYTDKRAIAVQALEYAKARVASMLGPNARVSALMFGVDNVAQSIVDYALKNQIDTIIMGSRGLGKLKGKLMGSVSSYVTQHPPCKVVIVH